MECIKWQSEKRKLADLKPAEYNPRQAGEKEYKDLETSLHKFNLADPIIINTNNQIIGGHFRIRVLQDKGIKEVDVRVPSRELTEKEERELNLRLNKNVGNWDVNLLANFDDDLLKDVGFDIENIFDGKAQEEQGATPKGDHWLWFECKSEEDIKFIKLFLGTNHKRKVDDVRLVNILKKAGDPEAASLI